LGRLQVSSTEIQQKELRMGDLVFGKSSVKREGIGYPSQFLGCKEPVIFSGFAYRARARRGISDARFLFYALRSEPCRRWLIDNSQASALTNINQTIAENIPVRMCPLAEQTAIAEVLTDVDAELTALERCRDKTRDLKQAMMQELLTGKTRLVPAGVVHA
jgi:type I restriction enzyme S subunit